MQTTKTEKEDSCLHFQSPLLNQADRRYPLAVKATSSYITLNHQEGIILLKKKKKKERRKITLRPWKGGIKIKSNQ